ncbi:molybdopterin-dependent oxidoreductase [Diaphorobacter sp. HDW4A]|uniref:molybdopterin-dependent oxidoreductase n=1 Tax=Diaphorobacter sp. HDW4A TaxID=2714924 RepID=UPI0014089396|nr:molybdopterin-dependent oxidoreductase [Diaphorobacter sp. HDW4A]QIL78514.1 molybdopterin-dependent oxidoreductase [Diaphorobacter sp. HDW4A]
MATESRQVWIKRRGLRFAAMAWWCVGGFAVARAEVAVPTGNLEILSPSREPVTVSARQLASLPQQSVRTVTAWTDGVKTFTGPLMTDVFKAVGISLRSGSIVQAKALNGYVITIPSEDFVRWPVIVAWSMDGSVLTRRDKGPLWIVYPRSSDSTLRDAKYDHRWAWQLRQLTVQSVGL